MPLAGLPIGSADAGRTTSASLHRASAGWPGLFSRPGTASNPVRAKTPADAFPLFPGILHYPPHRLALVPAPEVFSSSTASP